MAFASSVETGSLSSTVRRPSPSSLPGSSTTESINSAPVATVLDSVGSTPVSYSTTRRDTSPSMPLVGVTSTGSEASLSPAGLMAIIVIAYTRPLRRPVRVAALAGASIVISCTSAESSIASARMRYAVGGTGA